MSTAATRRERRKKERKDEPLIDTSDPAEDENDGALPLTAVRPPCHHRLPCRARAGTGAAATP